MNAVMEAYNSTCTESISLYDKYRYMIGYKKEEQKALTFDVSLIWRCGLVSEIG